MTQSVNSRIPLSAPLRIAITSVPATFRRGDANGDGRVDISDSIRIFHFLFLGAEAPDCLAAADADDTGTVELTDGIFVNRYLFAGGPGIPAPGPDQCGPDPTPDPLGCASYPACP